MLVETRVAQLLAMMREPNRPVWVGSCLTKGVKEGYDGEWFYFGRTPWVGRKTLERLAQCKEVEFIGEPRWGRCRLKRHLLEYNDDDFGDLWIE
jgi:hypothetical protein